MSIIGFDSNAIRKPMKKPCVLLNSQVEGDIAFRYCLFSENLFIPMNTCKL